MKTILPVLAIILVLVCIVAVYGSNNTVNDNPPAQTATSTTATENAPSTQNVTAAATNAKTSATHTNTTASTSVFNQTSLTTTAQTTVTASTTVSTHTTLTTASQTEASTTVQTTKATDVTTPSSHGAAQYETENGNKFTTNTNNKEALALFSKAVDYAATLQNASIYYTDVNRSVYFSYNASESHKTASVIKAPYIRSLLSSGIDLNETLTLRESQKKTGSGSLDEAETGSIYTVEQLIQYCIRRSDNTAYQMLLDRFGTSVFNAYAGGKGIDVSIPSNGYTNCTVKDMAMLFLDIYKYALTDDNGKMLIIHMKNCSFSTQITKGASEYEVAHKFGYISNGNAFHDAAIVYADTPYVLCIFTKIDDSVYATSPFVKISEFINNAHKELN